MGAALRILSIGLDPSCREQLAELLSGETVLEAAYDLEKLIENAIDPAPAVIVCGPSPAGVSLNEVAQGLRMSYQAAPIFFLTSVREAFDRKAFQKNGFTDAFLMPVERTFFARVFRDRLIEAGGTAARSFRPVRLVDVEPGVELPFDTFIHLPANGKYLKFAAEGDPLDAERVDRLRRGQVREVRIPAEQIRDFHRFTADRLRRLGKDGSISETERRDRLQNAVRDLFGGMFNDSSSQATTTHGKGIANDCQEIVKAYVVGESGKAGSWYEKILSVGGSEEHPYSHAANVATLAALFSLGTGVGKPEELAMAGVLHDIGLVDLPESLQRKPESEMTADERKAYGVHVELGLKMIRDRKLVVPEAVLKAIELHHERVDGSGYPHGRSGKQVPPAAQLLALANAFDRLTAVEEGKPTLSPLAAIRSIREANAENPGAPKFDADLVERLYALFLGETPVREAEPRVADPG